MKKAIAKISVAIHNRSRPSPKAMISTAPIKSSNPVVENNPTFVLAESCLSERLTKKVAIIANTQSVTRTTIAAVMKGITSPKEMLLMFGVIPENDEMVDQSPFQLGYSFIRKSLMFGRMIAIPIATDKTTPTMPAIMP